MYQSTGQSDQERVFDICNRPGIQAAAWSRVIDAEELELACPALAELAGIPHWVVADKRTKRPLVAVVTGALGSQSRSQRFASVTDPSTWAEFSYAEKSCLWTPNSCLGFVLTEADPFCVIDIDDGVNTDGTLKAPALEIVRKVDSYTELSPSGRGLHIWVYGKTPPGGNKKKLPNGLTIEIYDSRRYMTVTGNHLPGTPIEINEGQAPVNELHGEVFASASSSAHPTDTAQQQPVGSGIDDAELISRCSKNLAFEELYAGNIERYDRDESRADFAICCQLAEMTRDPAQIERVVSGSEMGRRKKWQLRKDYRDRTIANALKQTIRSATTIDSAPVKDKPSSPRGKIDAPADLRLEVLKSELELFHDKCDTGYAVVPIGDGIVVHPVQSEKFRQVLLRRASLQNFLPPKLFIDDLVATLNAEACAPGRTASVGVRLIESNGNIYFDLNNEAGQVVEITAEPSWRILDTPPVYFIRPPGMLGLPIPVRGGSLDELRPLVNMPDDRGWKLIVGYMVGAMNPAGPYAVLVVNGPAGSAKTSLCLMTRELIDPNVSPLRQPPKNERDLIIAASNSHMLAFDNVSYISDEISDALCRIATGAGFSTRRLYSNSEEQLFTACRPIMFNGIDEAATRADLLERALSIDLQPVKKRTTAEKLRMRFEALKPRLLGALFDAVAMALHNRGKVELDGAPRMADSAAWVEAAAPALGWQAGEYLQAMRENQEESASIAIDADRVGVALRAMMSKRASWSGTWGELLAELKVFAADSLDGRLTLPKFWPETTKNLRQTAFVSW